MARGPRRVWRPPPCLCLEVVKEVASAAAAAAGACLLRGRLAPEKFAERAGAGHTARQCVNAAAPAPVSRLPPRSGFVRCFAENGVR